MGIHFSDIDVSWCPIDREYNRDYVTVMPKIIFLYPFLAPKQRLNICGGLYKKNYTVLMKQWITNYQLQQLV